MKKIGVMIGSVMFASMAFAHQISGEFYDSSWNWNNGSHSAMVNKSIDVGNPVVHATEIIHTHTDVDVHNTVANDKAIAESKNQVVKSKNQVVKYRNQVVKYRNQVVDVKEPVFDTGIRPSNSK